MGPAVRYAVTVYVGLLMAGALMRPPGMAYGTSMPSGSAKLAPLKAPYTYPDQRDSDLLEIDEAK